MRLACLPTSPLANLVADASLCGITEFLFALSATTGTDRRHPRRRRRASPVDSRGLSVSRIDTDNRSKLSRVGSLSSRVLSRLVESSKKPQLENRHSERDPSEGH